MDSKPARMGPWSPCAGRRRRGPALEHAIFDATLSELGEVGYDGLTMERVAARSGTGKASLYRRWSGKEDLVVDALNHMLPPMDQPLDTGSVRGDLIVLLERMAATINSSAGGAMRSIMANLHCGPQMIEAVHSRVIAPRKQMMLDALRRGAERGEVRPDAVTMLVAQAGPALLVQQFLSDEPRVTRKLIEDIVDQVVMPMLRP